VQKTASENAEKITRHFTTATFVVCNQKVLMIYHRKLQRWLPPGGHLMSNELPEEGALREVMEETGIQAALWNKESSTLPEDVRILTPPVHMQLEKIPTDPVHYHIDFIFYATCSENQKVRIDTKEICRYKWMSAEEIREIPEQEIVENALKALKTLSVEK